MSERRRLLGKTSNITLPDGYTAVDYVSAGNTNVSLGYVDTGIILNENSSVKFKFATTNHDSSNPYYYSVIGGAENPHYFFIATYGGLIRTDRGGVRFDTSGGFNDGNVHVMKLDKNVLAIDNTVVKTFDMSCSAASKTMYLFKLNGQSAALCGYYLKFYEGEIWDDGVLVRHYIPCVNSSNVAYLFEAVNKTLHNLGRTNVIW